MKLLFVPLALLLLIGCKKDEEQPIPEASCMAYDTGSGDTAAPESSDDTGSEEGHTNDTSDEHDSAGDDADTGPADEEHDPTNDTGAESESVLTSATSPLLHFAGILESVWKVVW